MDGGDSPEVDTVEVCFRGSNNNQERKEGVLLRMKGDENKGGKAVELL